MTSGRKAREKRKAENELVVDEARTMKLLEPGDRCVINNKGNVKGPRLLLLDVEKNMWVPIHLGPGQWIIRRSAPGDEPQKLGTGKRRLILPPGYVPPNQ